MKRITSLLFLFLLFISFTAPGQDNSGPHDLRGEVEAYQREDSLAKPPMGGIVFAGSSAIKEWKGLDQLFPGKKVLNRGVSQARLVDIVKYAGELIVAYKPRKVFIYCGEEDIAEGKSPEKVFEDFRTLYRTIKSSLPETHIYYLSIQTTPARLQFENDNKRANELIKAYLANHTSDTFIDVYSFLLDRDRKPGSVFFNDDQLQMNATGYQRWERVLRSFVVQ